MAGTYTLDEVAKHTTKEDCWVVLNGNVLNVTSFLPDHPGGELAILTFAGKDATAEFDMIHPPDVIQKYAASCVIGKVGAAAAAPAPVAAAPAAVAAAPVAAAPASGGGLTMAEVAKHTTKDDCWVVLDGKVLDVTKFLPDHPGGELAILTFAGKDATAEFNMIHPPDVIEKYAKDTVLGPLAADVPVAAAPVAAAPVAAAPVAVAPVAAAPVDALRQPLLGEEEETASCVGSIFYLIKAFVVQILSTIFFTGNFKITGDRKGLTRSAMFLIMFMVIHAIGNLHVFLGPDDFNGYGYFYVRLYWTGFGLEANIVEEYVALCALLHVLVGLKRTWDISINYPINSGKLNLAISGVILFAFMNMHLVQFRFAETQTYYLRPPRYLIEFSTMLRLHLFYSEDKSIPLVGVRDIYLLEFDLFKSFFWCMVYVAFVCLFFFHYMLGWLKVVPSSALGIPKYHQGKINFVGAAIGGFIALCYLSFPIYAYLVEPSPGLYGKV